MERRQRHISQKGGRPRSVSKAVTSLAAILTVFPYIYILEMSSLCRISLLWKTFLHWNIFSGSETSVLLLK